MNEKFKSESEQLAQLKAANQTITKVSDCLKV